MGVIHDCFNEVMIVSNIVYKLRLKCECITIIANLNLIDQCETIIQGNLIGTHQTPNII
jgi:hypothetical protein